MRHSAATNVLVLEDEANDAILIKRAFTGAGCRAFVCRNTSEARAYFLGAGLYADRRLFPFPELFVTDLRLGEDSGLQFLAWVRSFHESKDLPVIILSGAATASEILAVQRLRATRVLIKPSNPIALRAMLSLASRELCPTVKRYEVQQEVSDSNVFAAA